MLTSALSFIGTHANKIYLANSIFQAGSTCYSTRNPENHDRINRVQAVFNCINIGSFFMLAKALITPSNFNKFSALLYKTLQPNYYLYKNIPPNYYTLLLKSSHPYGLILITSIVWCSCLAFSAGIINKVCEPRDDIKKWLKIGNSSDLKSEEDFRHAEYVHPTMKKVTQVFHLTQLIVSIALTTISSSPYFFAISAICHGYSLYKQSNITWVKPAFLIDPFALFLNKNAKATCDKCHKINPLIDYDGIRSFHPFCISQYFQEKRERLFA